MSETPVNQIEPELRSSLPRNARVKPQQWAALCFVALIGLVIACTIGWFAWRDLGDLYALRSRGVTAQATITDKRTVHGKSDTYYLSYTLRAYGAFIDDEDPVSASLYEQTSMGATVPVTFLLGQPHTHRLGHVGSRRVIEHEVDWASGMLGVAGLFGLCIAGMLYAYRKELRLARYGMPVAGTVSDCVPQRLNASTVTCRVSYRFMTPAGERTQTASVSEEVGKQLCAGSNVAVLYDPADPRHACLYAALQYTEVV